MVAQVLKHQWATTLVPLRKGAKPAEIFGLIFLVLVSLFLGGNYFAYVRAAGQLAIDPRGASTAVAGASLIVFWITVPVLFGAQPTYTDPSRYAVFSRRARELMPAFVVVGLLSWGGVVTLVASVSHVLAWSSAGAVAMVTAVLGVLLGWSAAMIASNLLLVAMSAVMAKRRFRETMMILVMLLCCGLGLGMQVVTRTATVTRTVPVNVGRIIGWTPLGWAWSMPWEVAHGRWLAFAIKLVVSIATVAVMVWAWQAIVARRLVAPTGDGGSVEKVKAANGIDRMMPATPTGAITGRTLRYLKRDPRMTSLLLNTFLVPLLASARCSSMVGARCTVRRRLSSLPRSPSPRCSLRRRCMPGRSSATTERLCGTTLSHRLRGWRIAAVARLRISSSPCRSAWRWPSSPPGGVVSGSCCRS
ncbi:hypothetical protein JCM18918_4375 [Cutibacterium acnes JCM 18918]|nr:hypothetical protein JCM18918_4375 [Cutibacterium acnes JCM 18918]